MRILVRDGFALTGGARVSGWNLAARAWRHPSSRFTAREELAATLGLGGRPPAAAPEPDDPAGELAAILGWCALIAGLAFAVLVALPLLVVLLLSVSDRLTAALLGSPRVFLALTALLGFLGYDLAARLVWGLTRRDRDRDRWVRPAEEEVLRPHPVFAAPLAATARSPMAAPVAPCVWAVPLRPQTLRARRRVALPAGRGAARLDRRGGEQPAPAREGTRASSRAPPARAGPPSRVPRPPGSADGRPPVKRRAAQANAATRRVGRSTAPAHSRSG